MERDSPLSLDSANPDTKTTHYAMTNQSKLHPGEFSRDKGKIFRGLQGPTGYPGAPWSRLQGIQLQAWFLFTLVKGIQLGCGRYTLAQGIQPPTAALSRPRGSSKGYLVA